MFWFFKKGISFTFFTTKFESNINSIEAIVETIRKITMLIATKLVIYKRLNPPKTNMWCTKYIGKETLSNWSNKFVNHLEKDSFFVRDINPTEKLDPISPTIVSLPKIYNIFWQVLDVVIAKTKGYETHKAINKMIETIVKVLSTDVDLFSNLPKIYPKTKGVTTLAQKSIKQSSKNTSKMLIKIIMGNLYFLSKRFWRNGSIK